MVDAIVFLALPLNGSIRGPVRVLESCGLNWKVLREYMSVSGAVYVLRL